MTRLNDQQATSEQEVRFGGEEREFVAIKVYQREFPEHRDYWDGNWLYARVDVAAGGFLGTATGSVRTDEFASLLSELTEAYESIKGTARFSPVEPWCCFDVQFHKRGGVVLEGKVCDSLCEGNSLNFRLDLDQTYVRPALQQLRELLKEFPVVGKG